ncbi:Gfo/Idh/MocA family protein [Natronorarus salvus]|uniref:Gfo/Idh/MocA family protein n=1 Tax=Natronorarus salvus TaxID=3117733 RepID=UPI002F26BAA9
MSLEVGILSAAHVHTDAYAAELSGRGDLSFVGVTDEDEKRGSACADRHGIEYVADPDELLDRIDAGVICAPNADHRAWIDRACAAGVHVLCEKPLAPTLEEASSIVDVWRESGVHVGVAMPLRFSEAAKRAKRALEDGEIGPIGAISGTNRGKMPGGWFVDPEQSGGGAVMDHTVHIVDLVEHLTDRSVAEVYAEIDTRFHEIPVEDVNVLSMSLSDGTPFLLDGSWSKPESWHTWGDATVEFVGSEGALAVDTTDQSVVHTVASGSQAGVHTVSHATDTSADLIADFVASVREDRDPMTTPEDGLRAVAVVEAAYESAERDEPVAVEL